MPEKFIYKGKDLIAELLEIKDLTKTKDWRFYPILEIIHDKIHLLLNNFTSIKESDVQIDNKGVENNGKSTNE